MISKLEKFMFESSNILSNSVELGGLATLLITSGEHGLNYLICGIILDLSTMARQSTSRYGMSEMPLYSRFKYSFIPPFKYIGR